MPDWSDRGYVMATRDQSVVYCRVVGVGNMNNCTAFQIFTERMFAAGYREFVVDFSTCHGLDSTFLGVLLGIALGDRKTGAHVVVVNASHGLRKALHEVGIDRLLDICPEVVDPPEVPLCRLEVEQENPKRRIGVIVRAHEDLCSIDAANESRFGRFLELMRAELAAGAGAGAHPPHREDPSDATTPPGS
ncbi:MAG: STAS domain-containing protein [Planctomycetota bacterium]